MNRRKLKVLFVTCGVLLGVASVAEVGLRRIVPENGTTMFQDSDVPGMPVLLRPNFKTLHRSRVVETNSHGFRGPEIGEKSAERRRIVLVGDSVTFGNGVDFEGTLGEGLRAALEQSAQPAEVLNLGIPGFNTPDIVATLQHKALPLDPDDVVYVFFANDIDPSPKYGPIDPESVIDPMHGFVGRSALLEWFAMHTREFMRNFGIFIGGSTPVVHRRIFEDEGGRERVRTGLQTMQALCTEAGCRFHVAVYPYMSPPTKSPMRVVDELVLIELVQMHICHVDLYWAFAGRNLASLRTMTFDHHPSPEANRLAGGYLAQYLLENASED